MKDVNEFLAYAIRLEEMAAARFTELGDAMDSFGNDEVRDLFRKMAHFSRLHLQEARDRANFREIPEIPPDAFEWPGMEPPETTAYEGADPQLGPARALELALESEKSGHAFYADIARNTKDPEIRMMAEEFEQEEAQHVAELERWIARRQEQATAAS